MWLVIVISYFSLDVIIPKKKKKKKKMEKRKEKRKRKLRPVRHPLFIKRFLIWVATRRVSGYWLKYRSHKPHAYKIQH